MHWPSGPRSIIAIAAAFVGAALILLVLGYGAAFWPSSTVAPPGSAPSAPAATTFELSVFDQPRDLPEIRFVDSESRSLTLADFRGKVVLLNVWATWCVPCRHEMPSLSSLEFNFALQRAKDLSQLAHYGHPLNLFSSLEGLGSFCALPAYYE